MTEPVRALFASEHTALAEAPRVTVSPPMQESDPAGEKLNVTDPPAVPPPGEVDFTLAVNFTACPRADGSTDEVTVTEVAARLTTWVAVPSLLA